MVELKGCALYFDCYAGIAGDMTLGAMIDLGVPEEVVRAELGRLPVGGYRVWMERVKRGALVGTKAHVEVAGEHGHDHALALAPAPAPDHGHDHDHGHHDHDHANHDHGHHDHGHAHRHYREIRSMLVEGLVGEVKERALEMFERIAVVEARLHGTTVEEVAFHEVGAIDSIVDIVGAAAALAWISPSRVTARRVPLGGGQVRTAHGILPVPAPATLELLRGAEVEAGGAELGELTTPTGAAILAASVSGYGPMPAMNVSAVGWGAGERELRDRPNLLRIVAGRLPALAAAGEVMLVEANVDDMSPELCEPLFEALFAAGALDVWLGSIVMKKGRPAWQISALCEPGRLDGVAQALLRESSTLGVRHRALGRTVLARELVEVATELGTVTVKLGRGPGGELWNVAPEYEVCRKIARERGVPVKQVYAAALAAFYRR